MWVNLNGRGDFVAKRIGVRDWGYLPVKHPFPTIERKKKPKKRNWVFLSEELWEAVDLAAQFQTKVFELEGEPEAVSRNDTIENMLVWVLAAYWQEKGGMPETVEEANALAADYVARKAAAKAARPPKPDDDGGGEEPESH